MGGLLPQATGLLDVPAAGRQAGRALPHGLQEDTSQPTRWSWTCTLQTCERAHFCGFKPSDLWCFVAAAQETNTQLLQGLGTLAGSSHSPADSHGDKRPTPHWESQLALNKNANNLALQILKGKLEHNRKCAFHKEVGNFCTRELQFGIVWGSLFKGL